MGLSRSLTVAQTSLLAHQRRLDVIANNVANVNTIGYKASRARFAENVIQRLGIGTLPIVSGADIGGVDPLQIGLGVRLAATVADMAQGTITPTNRPLDVAVRGDGFFVVQLNGRQLFTRAGSFTLDSRGNLVDTATGALVQGYGIVLDANGLPVRDSSGNTVLSRQVGALRIPLGLRSPAHQTERVRLSGNLSAEMADGESIATSILIYDSRGVTHVLRLELRKTATPGEFELTATLDEQPLTLPTGSSPVRFRGDGTLESPLSVVIPGAELNTALGANPPVFDPAKSLTIELAPQGSLLSGVTQMSGPSTLAVIEQDGYGIGELVDLRIDSTGKLLGSFSNGRTEVLGQLVLAQFLNPGGLLREGDNFFAVSPNSGAPILGTAGELFSGTSVVGGAVEESNVELTTEFTELIATQRAFEAAARIVTVSDQILAEVNALKR